MKMFAVLFASLFVSTVAGGQSTGGTWITDVTIVSPEALNHVVKGSVLIEGERFCSRRAKAKCKGPGGGEGGLRRWRISYSGIDRLACAPGFDSGDGL